MKIYEVVEYVDGEENANGYYSSLEKAQQAILTRVKECYTNEEMKAFHFDEYGYSYSTTENKYSVACNYTIFKIKLDEEIM
jgi:hypothetical protein